MVGVGAALFAWVSTGWAQANVYVPDVTIAFEDLVTDASESDRDYNDVAVRANRRCRFDGAGLLVGETTRVTGLASGAARRNAVRLEPSGPVSNVALIRDGVPEAAAFDGSGRVRLWDDFRQAFDATGLVNTGEGAVAHGQALTVEITYAPGVATGGRCPDIDLVVVREGEGVAIDRASTLPPNNQPLAGQFPGNWPVPLERTPIETAYPKFLDWLDEQALGCGLGCDDEDWFFHPSAADVLVRTDLATTAPLSRPETCADGAQNQDETDVDCGGDVCGPCPATATHHCADRVQNADEQGVDCGGADCFECVTDCEGAPMANPALEVLRFEGEVTTLYFADLPGPEIGDPLTGWVAWDPHHADDQNADPSYGLYCYDDIPGQFQMVIRSGSDCWQTLDWPYPLGDANTCQRVENDATPYGTTRDYLELWTWEFGKSDRTEYGLGTIWLWTTELGAWGDDAPRDSLPPLSAFDEAVIYLEIGDLEDNYRGAVATMHALRGNLVAPEPEPAATTWFYTSDRVGGNSTIVRLGDVNGDGDALDAGENVPLYTFTGENVFYAAPGPDDAVYAYSGLLRVYRLHDADGNGTFEAGEKALFADLTGRSGVQDLAVGPTGIVYVGTTGGVWRYTDRNGDHDALDAGESEQFSSIGVIGMDLSVESGRDVIWGNYYEVSRAEDTSGDGRALYSPEARYYGYLAATCSGGLQAGVAVDPTTGRVHGLTRNSGACSEVAIYQDLNGDGDAKDAGEAVKLGTFTVANGNGIAFAPDGTLLATSTDASESVVRLVDSNGDLAFEKHLWASGLSTVLTLHPGPAIP